jgi:hypothetical protein
VNIQNKIDEQIAMLQQLRVWLADPEKFALVKKLVADGEFSHATNQPLTPGNTPRLRGEMQRTAFQCVQNMDGQFTGRELVEKMRTAGYEFFGNEMTSIQSVLRKFVELKIVDVIDEGAGRRPRIYELRRTKGGTK